MRLSRAGRVGREFSPIPFAVRRGARSETPTLRPPGHPRRPDVPILGDCASAAGTDSWLRVKRSGVHCSRFYTAVFVAIAVVTPALHSDTDPAGPQNPRPPGRRPTSARKKENQLSNARRNRRLRRRQHLFIAAPAAAAPSAPLCAKYA